MESHSQEGRKGGSPMLKELTTRVHEKEQNNKGAWTLTVIQKSSLPSTVAWCGLLRGVVSYAATATLSVSVT